jgi:hypothetical protein
MNDVEALPQMKLPLANEVMLRVNDVALRANGSLRFHLKKLMKQAKRICFAEPCYSLCP